MSNRSPITRRGRYQDPPALSRHYRGTKRSACRRWSKTSCRCRGSRRDKHDAPHRACRPGRLAARSSRRCARTRRFPWSANAEAAVVAGDRSELAQVLRNLIDNAIKYGKAGAPVTLTIEIDRIRADRDRHSRRGRRHCARTPAAAHRTVLPRRCEPQPGGGRHRARPRHRQACRSNGIAGASTSQPRPGEGPPPRSFYRRSSRNCHQTVINERLIDLASQLNPRGKHGNSSSFVHRRCFDARPHRLRRFRNLGIARFRARRGLVDRLSFRHGGCRSDCQVVGRSSPRSSNRPGPAPA